MLKKRNHAGMALAMLPLMCAMAASTAFGADTLQAQAKPGGNLKERGVHLGGGKCNPHSFLSSWELTHRQRPARRGS